MLDFLIGRTSERRLRLFAVAAARDLLEHNPDPDQRGDGGDVKEFGAAILRAEACADGQAPLKPYAFGSIWVELPSARDAAYVVLGMDPDVGMFMSDPATVVPAAIASFQVNPVHWLRDIFANPFFPVAADPSWLAWNDGAVIRIARDIYARRDFHLLPILADAMEEAGCDNGEILKHCRREEPHVRGCWVLDLVLAKE
jgi:hypothetical protein